MTPTPERGVTLTELTIVMVLAGLVTVGLVTFYLNSQGMWVDGSAQALTQRDATLVLETITRHARRASGAEVVDDPDSDHQTLSLFDQNRTEITSFWWSPEDSLIHQGLRSVRTDDGPITMSKAERFQFESNGELVQLRALWMRSTSGSPVELSSAMALYNK